jgi:hypothetical protein
MTSSNLSLIHKQSQLAEKIIAFFESTLASKRFRIKNKNIWAGQDGLALYE